MSFINKFPYSDAHELNLDWIISEVKRLASDMDTFKGINEIKYDGIWDITKQYEPWTVVNNNNYAYLSIKAVPAGIDILNTEYWVYVSMFSIDMALSNTSINPVANRVIKAKLDDIDADIISTNSRITLELRDEAEAREAADTSLSQAINAEATTRAQADTALSDRIDALIDPATVDSEVIDMRTNLEGITFTTAGGALRSLEGKVNAIQNYAFIAESYVKGDGSIVPGTIHRFRTDYMPCDENISVTYASETDHNNVCGIAFFDENKVFISGFKNNESTAGNPVTVTSPTGTKFAMVSTKDTVLAKTFFSPAKGGLLSVADDLYGKIAGDTGYLHIETNGTNRSVAYTALSDINIVYTHDPDYEITLYYDTDYHTSWSRFLNIKDYPNPDYIQIRKTDNSNMAAGTAYKVVQAIKEDSVQLFNSPAICYGYVDGVNGSNSNSGLGKAAALQTISAAVNKGFRHIIIAPGTYEESIAVNRADELELRADIGNTFDYPDSVDNPLVIIDATGNNEGLDIRNVKKVTLVNIKVVNAERFGIYLNAVNDLKCEYCFADTCANGGFKLQDVTGNFYNCDCHLIGTPGGSNHYDGFNMHGTGTTNFFNCSASYCEDDGISHHDACCGLIDGGEWHHCGKGGVASPTHGAVVDVKNIYSHDNRYGIYCDSEDEFDRRTVNFTNCACKNNTTTDIRISSDYTANVWNCIYDTITSGDHINIIG